MFASGHNKLKTFQLYVENDIWRTWVIEYTFFDLETSTTETPDISAAPNLLSLPALQMSIAQPNYSPKILFF